VSHKEQEVLLIPKKILVIGILTILLASSIFASISTLNIGASAQTNGSTTSSSANLNQYDWPQFQGDESFTRFSAGPAPDTSNVLWKANVPGIQPYLTAFDGLIFVGTNTSLVAVNQAGQIAWSTPIPMNKTWPIAYEIDSSHLVVEGSCLDPNTGKILWTSTAFCADTGIFSSNVYSPEEKLFYVKENSYIIAWNFSDPSRPPTVAWTTYIPGGGITGIGTTYGDGLVFAGSFLNQQFALNATTGAIVWDTLTKGPMIFDGAYSDSLFFRGGTDDNTMYCFNATNGQIVWTYTPPSDPSGYFTTGPAVAYGIVYEMNKDGYLYAFNETSGVLLWKHKAADNTLIWPGMPTVADGMIYVTTGQFAAYNTAAGISQFACINAYTGQTIWTLPIEALAPRESDIVAYGNLYIIPGNVTTAVDTTSGTEYSTDSQLWAIGTVPPPTVSTTPPPTITPIPTPSPTPAPTLAPVTTSISSNWSMFRSNPAHSSTAAIGPSNLTLAWKFTTGGSVVSSPTVVNGVVYVGSQDKNVYAIGALSGDLIWKYTTGGSIEDSPAVANGMVYVESDNGYVYCLNAKTGSLNWKTFIDSNLPFTYANLVLTSSPVVSNDLVYIGSLDGYLYALNAKTGAVVWKASAGGPIECSPAYDDGAVFFTSQQPTEGMLFSLNATTGSAIWSLPLPYQHSFVGGTEMLGSPSIANGVVFASSDWGAYYAVNETTGKEIWDFINPVAIEFIVSSPIYVNGDLYIIDIFNIACFNATNGHELWSAYTGDELYVSPSYASGYIYVATSQRHIYVLNTAENGTKIATVTTPSSSWSSPAIANGMLYIGCNDWNVYCFSGYVSAQVSTPTPTPAPNITLTPALLALIAGIVTVVIVLVAVADYVIRKKSKKSAPTAES
jgi:outer membrane protein assembly factor BamB